MVPEQRYPFLATLLSPFERRHRKTLGLMIAAIAVTGQARSFAIATTLARWLGTRLDSAVNRFYRLLRNDRVDYLELVNRWAELLARGPQRSLLLAVDWTEWHHDLRMLAAAVVTGKRGIPLFVQAFHKAPPRSQNSRENTFLRLVALALRRAKTRTTLLFDRGFRRVSVIKLLQDLDLGFVVRLQDDVHVELEPQSRVPLRRVFLCQGRVLDLGVIALRSDGKVQARVIGYWAPHAHEPWWLATNETAPASFVLRLYDRRMTVEEQFRDTKGARFGVRLYWTHFRSPEALSRFVMLLAVALLIWMLAGRNAARRDPSLLLRHRKKGPRQSYVTIGLRILCFEPVPLRISFLTIRRLLEPPALRHLGKLAPGGK